MVEMQPKMKRKYKTKKEKEKDVAFEELAAIGKPMVEVDLFEEETQCQRDLMEKEVVLTPPRKSKKKKGKDGVGPNKNHLAKVRNKKGKDGVEPNKASTQENTPSPIAQSKGRTETNVGSLMKKPFATPKKTKERKKFLIQMKSLYLVHVHLHSFKKSSNEGDFLLVPLNEPIEENKGKRALERLEMDKFSMA
jgi:hypothetical protein